MVLRTQPNALLSRYRMNHVSSLGWESLHTVRCLVGTLGALVTAAVASAQSEGTLQISVSNQVPVLAVRGEAA